ncbi:MAG: ABC transporter permease [Tannerellaceae bacterium]|nr:ABC transporter permease [Tannerellaceae bacterium]
MLKQYFKQAWFIIQANPLVSIISITGTALSIAMIMVVVLIFQIQLAGYAPEDYRARTLYINGVRAVSENQRNGSNFSSEAIKEVIYSLQIPEAVTAYKDDKRPVSLPSKRLYKSCHIKFADVGFWKVFNFHFLKGQPFSEADFLSAIPKAVVSDKLARELFGTEDVIGQTILLDQDPFTICGIVREVSKAASTAYGEVFVPYTVKADIMSLRYSEGITGNLVTAILAKDKKDFRAIKDEINLQTNRYNESKTEFRLQYDHEPLDRLDIAIGSSSFRKVEVKDAFIRIGALLLFLLILPALNLTGINQAFVQQRRSEVGLRKSFGATIQVLMWQILTENLLTTCIGGAIGLILSFLLLGWSKSFLLSDDPDLNVEMLFQPSLFILILVFILLLNVLTAFLPAYKISRQPIIDALKENE